MIEEINYEEQEFEANDHMEKTDFKCMFCGEVGTTWINHQQSTGTHGNGDMDNLALTCRDQCKSEWTCSRNAMESFTREFSQ